jgi:hypothetical protein
MPPAYRETEVSHETLSVLSLQPRGVAGALPQATSTVSRIQICPSLGLTLQNEPWNSSKSNPAILEEIVDSLSHNGMHSTHQEGKNGGLLSHSRPGENARQLCSNSEELTEHALWVRSWCLSSLGVMLPRLGLLQDGG